MTDINNQTHYLVNGDGGSAVTKDKLYANALINFAGYCLCTREEYQKQKARGLAFDNQAADDEAQRKDADD